MTETAHERRVYGGIATIASGFAHIPFLPQICFEPENETGTDDVAAKAAAEKAAAEKAAAEKAAAEKAAAEKELEDRPNGVSDGEAKLLKEIMEKKNRLQKAEAAVRAAEERLKAYEGIDPEVARKLLAAQADAEKKALEAKGEFDRVKQMMAEEHTRTVEALKAESATIAKALAEARQQIDELTIGQSFATSKFVNKEMVMTPAKARIIYGSHFEMEDGQLVGYDKPKGAQNRTRLVGATGEPLPFDEALRKIVDADPDKDNLLRSKLKSGAGSGTEDVRARPSRTTDLHGVARIEASLKGQKPFDGLL